MPLLQQQMIEETLIPRNFVLYPFDPSYSQEVIEVIEHLIAIVAKDSGVDSVRCLANVCGVTTFRNRPESYSIFYHIERVLLPSKFYFNFANSDCVSTDKKYYLRYGFQIQSCPMRTLPQL